VSPGMLSTTAGCLSRLGDLAMPSAPMVCVSDTHYLWRSAVLKLASLVCMAELVARFLLRRRFSHGPSGQATASDERRCGQQKEHGTHGNVGDEHGRVHRVVWPVCS